MLAIGLTVLAGSAIKFGNGARAEAKLATADELQAKTEREVAESALSSVRALKGVSPRSVVAVRKIEKRDLALATGIGALMTSAEANGVRVASAETVGTPSTGAPLESMFSPVPLTNGALYRTDVAIKGDYKDYQGFKGFFAGLAHSGVSVQSVQVRQATFEATLRFYGV